MSFLDKMTSHGSLKFKPVELGPKDTGAAGIELKLRPSRVFADTQDSALVSDLQRLESRFLLVRRGVQPLDAALGTSTYYKLKDDIRQRLLEARIGVGQADDVINAWEAALRPMQERGASARG